MDLHWPCDGTAQSSILPIGSVCLVQRSGIVVAFPCFTVVKSQQYLTRNQTLKKQQTKKTIRNVLPCTTVAALPHRNLRSGQSHTGRHRQRQGPGDVEMKYRWRQTSLVRIINMLSSSSRETFESASWAIFAEYK